MEKKLYPYMSLIEFLAKVLGPDYEVALHSFSEKDSSIIAIVNGHISGRKIGAPLNKKSLEAISKGVHKEKEFISDYVALSADNKMLRSNTYFIKDINKNLIGLLCVNFDDSRYQGLIKDVLKLCHPDNFIEEKYIYKENASIESVASDGAENFYSSMEETVDEIFKNIKNELNVSPERMKLEEKMDVVDRLNEQGVFILKGAVRYVASKLKCSQASIYRYLKRVKGGGK